MTAAPVIVWFRQDLRLTDNPALAAAVSSGRPVLPIYVLDDETAGDWRIGGASRWWLDRSLRALDASLDRGLRCFAGPAERIVVELVRELGTDLVVANSCFEPWRVDRDARIGRRLGGDGARLELFQGTTLFDPDAVLKGDGTPYRVFTPFYRKGCLGNAAPPREPLRAPADLCTYAGDHGMTIDALRLMPEIAWYEGMAGAWNPGEAGALERLERFVETGLDGYDEGRDRPDLAHVSRLSPHLHFGELSPNQAWHAVLPHREERALERHADRFLSELGWREFSYYLLRHWPTLPHANLQSKFDRFPWQQDGAALERWQMGMTGYPIVDAGMRELWTTGYMHNRVRMIVASFLVKNLLLHWHEGERWFWDTLVDADLANNSASWQWVAGSGADAAPYFRIFNPVTQGQKFDPNGDYVRAHVPELAGLDGAAIHTPWSAKGASSLDYPEPIVDLKASRERALEAFHSISGG
jgi:deoxyribodipyrimidine photo-lyase